MDSLLLILILTLNIAISIWNCYAVGVAWKDVKAMGSGFDKILLWSGIIQSGVGFSMPILLGLAYGSVAFLTSGESTTLTPDQGQRVLEAIFSLWYIAGIFPILGSGLAIWAHSVRTAYERRDFTSIVAAGWNTFAQIHNTIDAFQNIGGALGNIGELFSGALESDSDDAKGKIITAVFLIVLIALASGFVIALGLVRYFSRTSESRIEAHAKDLQSGRKVEGELIPKGAKVARRF